VRKCERSRKRRDTDDRRVACIVCRLLTQTFVGFLNNTRKAGARLEAAPLAPVGEDQLETLEVQARFVIVLFQGFAEFRRPRGFGQAWQRPDHLRFGVIQIAKLVEIEILQRRDDHDGFSWGLGISEAFTQSLCPRLMRYSRPTWSLLRTLD
jgi:hypothetical protein